jgi:peptide-methionine (S)-S-oxide reductase
MSRAGRFERLAILSSSTIQVLGAEKALFRSKTGARPPDIFWHTHNPTTLNRQGNDVGTQYRSALFYHNQAQKEIAEKSKKDLEKEGVYKDPIVTEITDFRDFYVAEDYHKNYYENHQEAPYCNFIIDPKVNKLLLKYGNTVKEEYK